MKQPSRKPKPTPDFSFSSGTPYADKGEYIEKGLAFSVISAERQEGLGFEESDRWAITVEPDDKRGQEILTFGCNEKRDAQLEKAKAHIEKRGAIRNVTLRKSGNAYYLHNASP